MAVAVVALLTVLSCVPAAVGEVDDVVVCSA